MIVTPNTEYPPTLVDWMKSKGITPEAASAAGVEPIGIDAVRYPNGRTRQIEGHTKQPGGTPLAPWPVGGEIAPRAIVMIAEGETDALAIYSAIEGAGTRALQQLAGVRVLAVPGASCPPGRTVEALPVGATAILCFDADDPGRKAAARYDAALRAAGVDVFDFGGLPDGCKDMSDYLAPLPPGERGDRLAEIVPDALTAIESERPSTGSDDQGNQRKHKVSATVQTPRPRVVPRPLADLLDAIEAFVRRYVVLPNSEAAKVVALWVAHTYAIDSAHATPYLSVLSPEKQSGKTRLLDVLEVLAFRPWKVSGPPSEAVLFRQLDNGVALLLDEADALWAVATERTEGLRAILNSGNYRGASVPRCDAKSHEVSNFHVFGPKVLAGIDNGRHPDTVRDRSIEIRMRRKKHGESVERFKRRRAINEALQLCDELEAWADDDLCSQLEQAEPGDLDDLSDRLNEAAEPLLAIADCAGGNWPGDIRQAVIVLSGEAGDDADSLGTLTLRKLFEVFGDRSAVSSAELCDSLNADDQLPFGGWRGGEGLNSRGLAKLLKPYKVRPKSVRIGSDTPKGYARDDLLDVWARYTSDLKRSPQHAAQPDTAKPHPAQDVAEVADVADSQSTAADAELQAEAERLLRDHDDIAGGAQ